MAEIETRHNVSQLLDRWKNGDRSVESELIGFLYPLLRDMAYGQVRRNRGLLTLSTTELANEAYERLCQQQSIDWQNRGHFLAIAATVMRRVVVDYIRHRHAEKRGGQVEIVALDEVSTDRLPRVNDQIDWLATDQALNELARVDPECARIVELRVFGGFGIDEIASLSGASTATIGRRWRYARAWLAERLDPSGEQGVD